MKLRNLTLSTKFTLAIGLILFTFCAIFSLLLYLHLKNMVIEDAEKKTLIVMTKTSAIGSYVREVLRPRMYEILHDTSYKEDFVIEAMSTTYVRLNVMSRVNETLPDYTYRRVSVNPINPSNKADPLHEEKISYFQQNRSREFWNGIVKIEGQEFLMRVKPVIAETECLKCHGDLSEAPTGLIKRYGLKSGFGWRDGDVVGVDSVAIPLAAAMGEIKDIAISTFIFGFTALLFLFISLHGAFWSLVSKPLSSLKATQSLQGNNLNPSRRKA